MQGQRCVKLGGANVSQLGLECAVAGVDEEVDGAVGHNHQPVGRLVLVADHRAWSEVERLCLEQELGGGGVN
jgi:hypothetical protein